jgi:hypothetical protein
MYNTNMYIVQSPTSNATIQPKPFNNAVSFDCHSTAGLHYTPKKTDVTLVSKAVQPLWQCGCSLGNLVSHSIGHSMYYY